MTFCRFTVGQFSEMGSLLVDYNVSTPAIAAIRIVTQTESDAWIILNEIHFRTTTQNRALH